jgi:hypothetical protein
VERSLRFRVTDDAHEAELQRRFESRLGADGASLPSPGMYDRALDPVASLHLVSHAHVVVYFREGLSGRELAPLRELSDRAVALQIPLVVSPREQRSALVAVKDGVALMCAAADRPEHEAIRSFSAALYPSLTG